MMMYKTIQKYFLRNQNSYITIGDKIDDTEHFLPHPIHFHFFLSCASQDMHSKLCKANNDFICLLSYLHTNQIDIHFIYEQIYGTVYKIYLMNVSFLPHSSFPYQITSLSFTHKKVSVVPSNILIVCIYINLQTRGQTTKSTNDMANKMIKLCKK